MIECPVCKHQEFVGSLFCSECGTRLVRLSSTPTMQVPRDRIDQEASVTKPGTVDVPELEPGAVLGLRVVSTGAVLSLVGRDNYTLGRVIPTEAIIPDIDLAPFRAHDHGVSRIHAEIRIDPEGVHVVDLESANGTLVNGKRLSPQEPTRIRHGDIVQLGSLSLQLISRFRG
jgi:hypothetical protein